MSGEHVLVGHGFIVGTARRVDLFVDRATVCCSTATSFRAERNEKVGKEADVGMSIKGVEYWSQRGRVAGRIRDQYSLGGGWRIEKGSSGFLREIDYRPSEWCCCIRHHY